MVSPQAPPPWATTGRPLVMGILNVTPDSFSDGGAYPALEAAAARARAMADQGAAILDIGGESTRPGFSPVSAEDEAARVLPVLQALGGTLPIPISIDTTKATVARQALARGATIVNDIWGFQADPAMADVVAEAGAAAVLMHNRHAVETAIDIVADLLRFFEVALGRAAKAGLPFDRIALDPGIGFGKTAAQQIEAVRSIPRLIDAFGLPVLVGLSRKSMLKQLTGSALDRRLPDTIAANLAARRLGASIFRVHDVAEHVAALTVFDALATENPP